MKRFVSVLLIVAALLTAYGYGLRMGRHLPRSCDVSDETVAVLARYFWAYRVSAAGQRTDISSTDAEEKMDWYRARADLLENCLTRTK